MLELLDQSSRNFVCSSAVTVARLSSGGLAICYAFLVLWMTSCLAVMSRMALRGRPDLLLDVSYVHDQGGVWCLWILVSCLSIQWMQMTSGLVSTNRKQAYNTCRQYRDKWLTTMSTHLRTLLVHFIIHHASEDTLVPTPARPPARVGPTLGIFILTYFCIHIHGHVEIVIAYINTRFAVSHARPSLRIHYAMWDFYHHHHHITLIEAVRLNSVNTTNTRKCGK